MAKSTDGQSILQTYAMSSGTAQRTDVSISQQSIFDAERYVDQNPSRSNYLKYSKYTHAYFLLLKEILQRCCVKVL